MINTRALQPLPIAIDKLPACCASPEEFEAGDIIIFDINCNYQNPAKHCTVIVQKMFNNHGGHKDAVHAAFVVEINGKKKIAHLRANGFVLDDINMIKTVAHVYRPRIHQKEIADEISHYIENHIEELKKKLRWKNVTAAFSFVRRLVNSVGIKNSDPDKLTKPVENPELLPTQDQFISSWNVCSKFLTQSYAGSCNSLTKRTREDFRSALMNITSNTLPKTLQAYLYRCSNYSYYVMPHLDERGKITDNLQKIVREEIVRLKTGKFRSIQKAQDLEVKINEFFSHLSEEKVVTDVKSDFEQAKSFLKEITPLLKINTGNNVKIPSSYQRVISYASSQGLYADYFEKDLKFNSNNHDLTTEAKQAYQYNEKLASKYSQYRQLGFSDAEARFECKPKLWDWMKINRRRNIAAAVTVVPFVFWSIPYGIARVYKAKQKNAALDKVDVSVKISVANDVQPVSSVNSLHDPLLANYNYPS